MKSMLKKTIAVMLLASMALTAVACADEGAASDGTTTAANTTAATTTKATTTTTTSNNPNSDPTTGGEDVSECPPYDTTEIHKTLGHTWCEANYYWTVDDDGAMVVDPDGGADRSNGIVVAYGEEFTGGTITVELTTNPNSTENDSGIIFCLQEAESDEEAYFFEGPRSYYFVFINDAGGVHIAKVADLGNGWWNNLIIIDKASVDVLANYTHGDTITLSVTYDAGYITASVNGVLVAEYDDTANPLTGTGWGLRGEAPNTRYTSVTVEPAE